MFSVLRVHLGRQPILKSKILKTKAQTPTAWLAWAEPHHRFLASQLDVDRSTHALGLLSVPEDFSNYIRLNYPPLPAGLSQGFSMLIQNSDGYGLSLVSDGANKMLWLSKITGYDADGNPSWQVKDVLGLSNLEAGLTLIPDGCLLDGVPDSEIFVAGRNGVVVLAWRANTSLGKFEALATDGIRCNSDKAVDIT